MKIKAKQEPLPKIFLPVELTIVFDTQEEIDRFYAIFNHRVISHFLDPIDYKAGEIRQNIRNYISYQIDNYWYNLDNRIKENG